MRREERVNQRKEEKRKGKLSEDEGRGGRNSHACMHSMEGCVR